MKKYANSESESSNTKYNRNKNYTERKLVYPQFQFDFLPNYESHLRMRNLEEVFCVKLKKRLY